MQFQLRFKSVEIITSIVFIETANRVEGYYNFRQTPQSILLMNINNRVDIVMSVCMNAYNSETVIDGLPNLVEFCFNNTLR